MTKRKKFPHERHRRVIRTIRRAGGLVTHLMRGADLPAVYVVGEVELPAITVEELIEHRRLLPADAGLLPGAAQTYALVESGRW